jgi:transposase
MSRLVEGLAADWRHLDERIDQLSNEIHAMARDDQNCERLMSVPGIGPIISSAMVATIGGGEVCPQKAASQRAGDRPGQQARHRKARVQPGSQVKPPGSA